MIIKRQKMETKVIKNDNSSGNELSFFRLWTTEKGDQFIRLFSKISN